MQWLFDARQSGCGGNPIYNTNTEKDEPFFYCAWQRGIMHSGFNRKIWSKESTGEIKRRWQSDIDICFVDIFLKCEPNLTAIN
jgi:hypothetical protein